MTLTAFNNDWFARMITRVQEHHPNASADAHLLAEAIMVGGAFVAETLTEALQDNDVSLAKAVGDVASAAEHIAEGLERNSESE
jgi:hypothetical protein